MARQGKPRQGETLAQYIDRLLQEQPKKLSVNGLARKLATIDGATEDTWQRTLRRWTAGTTQTISEENAAAMGEALSADFSSFVRGGNGVKDLLTQALQRLEKLEERIAALEQP